MEDEEEDARSVGLEKEVAASNDKTSRGGKKGGAINICPSVASGDRRGKYLDCGKRRDCVCDTRKTIKVDHGSISAEEKYMTSKQYSVKTQPWHRLDKNEGMHCTRVFIIHCTKVRGERKMFL